MNSEPASLDRRLLALLHATRDEGDDSARAGLNRLLRDDPAARAAMARLLVDEQALVHTLRDRDIAALLDAVPSESSSVPPASSDRRRPRPRRPWPPLWAAAAGLAFGAFGSSMVYGYIAQQREFVHVTPVEVFDPGFEDSEAAFDTNLPHAPGQWGVNAASVSVTAENGVRPLVGERMLRLGPRDEAERIRTSRAYQMIDLRPLSAAASGDSAEIRVTASFAAARGDASARYRIHAVILAVPPESANRDFWEQAEELGAVSISRNFNVPPGEDRWHTHSLRVPVPPEAKTLVLVLGALPPEDPAAEAEAHYLDDVRVDLLGLSPARPQQLSDGQH
jgi:hypothetical protein